MALRKRLSEVAQLQEELADSRAALEEHRVTAACWKRQCTKIAASAARNERKRCQKEMRKLVDKLGLPGVQVLPKATESTTAECQRILTPPKAQTESNAPPDRMRIGYQCKIADAS